MPTNGLRADAPSRAQSQPPNAMSISGSAFASWLEQQQTIESKGKIFVVGCYKSGTTWLQRSLDSHPEMVVKGESCAAWKLIPILNQALNSYDSHQKLHNHPTFTHLQNLDCLAQYRSVVNSLLLKYLNASDVPHERVRVVGDKTPQHAVGIGILSAIYPGAKFVHIVRDPRDAAISSWFHGPPLKFGDSLDQHVQAFLCKNWPVNVRGASQSGDLLGTDHFFELRYEDLLADPASLLQRVFAFCGVDHRERVAEEVASRCSFSCFTNGRANGDEERENFYRKGVAGDWKNHLDSAQVAPWCHPIRDLMDRYGYEI